MAAAANVIGLLLMMITAVIVARIRVFGSDDRVDCLHVLQLLLVMLVGVVILVAFPLDYDDFWASLLPIRGASSDGKVFIGLQSLVAFTVFCR